MVMAGTYRNFVGKLRKMGVCVCVCKGRWESLNLLRCWRVLTVRNVRSDSLHFKHYYMYT